MSEPQNSSGVSSLSGHFLIAGKDMRDPNFYQTVVLIIEHGESGAMGLVVNRPSPVKVSKALAEHFDLPESDDRIHVGGPVESTALFIVHNAQGLDEDARAVVPGLYLGSSAEVFETVVRAAAQGQEGVRFRILSGCAGWGPGQLEGELARADWLVLPATAEIVLSDDPHAVWEQALRQAYDANKLLPKFKGDPELN